MKTYIELATGERVRGDKCVTPFSLDTGVKEILIGYVTIDENSDPVYWTVKDFEANYAEVNSLGHIEIMDISELAKLAGLEDPFIFARAKIAAYDSQAIQACQNEYNSGYGFRRIGRTTRMLLQVIHDLVHFKDIQKSENGVLAHIIVSDHSHGQAIIEGLTTILQKLGIQVSERKPSYLIFKNYVIRVCSLSESNQLLVKPDLEYYDHYALDCMINKFNFGRAICG